MRARNIAAVLIVLAAIASRETSAATVLGSTRTGYAPNLVCATRSVTEVAATDLADGFRGFRITPAGGTPTTVIPTDGAGHPIAVSREHLSYAAVAQDPVAKTFAVDELLPTGDHNVDVIDFAFVRRCPDYTTYPATYFSPVAPTRALDTRPASAVGFSGAKPGRDGGATVSLAGRAPANAVAVAVNVTATETEAAGYVSAFTTGGFRSSSTLNVERAGQTIANGAVVMLGANDDISVYTQNPAHLIVDVLGYYIAADGPMAAGRFIDADPTRVLDTRSASRVGYTGDKPLAGSVVRARVAGGPNLPPASSVSAVMVNLTATEAAAAGFVQGAAAGALVPGASSNVNIDAAGQTIANFAVVPVSASGEIELYTQSSAHLLVDVLGWFTSDAEPPAFEGLYVPVPSERVLDTRGMFPVNYNAVFSYSHGPGNGVDLNKPAPGTVVPLRFDGLPVEVGSVVMNLTATQSSGAGYIQAGALGEFVAGASSNLNVERADETIANLVVVPTNVDNAIGLYTQRGTNMIADLAGFYLSAAADLPN